MVISKKKKGILAEKFEFCPNLGNLGVKIAPLSPPAGTAMFTRPLPNRFHLFLSLDSHMKNRTFNIEDHLKTEVHNFFQSKTKDFYKNGITKLLNRWEKVIECEGLYFDE